VRRWHVSFPLRPEKYLLVHYNTEHPINRCLAPVWSIRMRASKPTPWRTFWTRKAALVAQTTLILLKYKMCRALSSLDLNYCCPPSLWIQHLNLWFPLKTIGPEVVGISQLNQSDLSNLEEPAHPNNNNKTNCQSWTLMVIRPSRLILSRAPIWNSTWGMLRRVSSSRRLSWSSRLYSLKWSSDCFHRSNSHHALTKHDLLKLQIVAL